MGAGKNILLVIVSILLVLSIFVMGVLLTANTLLYPEIYVEALNENGAYFQLGGFTSNLTGDIPVGNLINIPDEEEELRVVIYGATNNFLSYLRGEVEKPNLNLELDVVNLRDLLETEVESFPLCSSGESSRDLQGDLVCRPPEKSVSDFLEEVLIEQEVNLPDSGFVDLSEVYDLENDDIQQIRDSIGTYQNMRYVVGLIVLFFVGLLFLISASARIGMMVTGIDFSIAGILVIIGSIFGRSFVGNSGIGGDILKKIVETILNNLLSISLKFGLTFIGGGVVALVASFLFKKKLEKVKTGEILEAKPKK